VIRRLAFVQLSVQHWPIALEFYRDLLGLTVAQIAENEQWVAFNVGDVQLVIYGGGVAANGPKTVEQNAFVPNLACDDLAGTVATLESRGVPFVSRLQIRPDGYRLATIVDPEGNQIQLFEWTGAQVP